MGDLIVSFSEAAKNAQGSARGTKNVQGLGPAIGNIMAAVTDSLDVFSNPDKIKKIEGYDENGRPKYSMNEFINLDQVIGNMVDAVTRIIGAFGTPEIAKAMDNLDIDKDENIGEFIGQFVRPFQGFADTAVKLSAIKTSDGKQMDLWTLGIQISHATIDLVKDFAEADVIGIAGMTSFSSAFDKFSKATISGYEGLLKFDTSDTTTYVDENNKNGSAIVGVSKAIRRMLNILLLGFTKDNTPDDFKSAFTSSVEISKVIKNLQQLPGYMEKFISADPDKFNEGSKAAYDGLFTITQISKKGEGAGKSHLQLFANEMIRLAKVADPFTKFANAFGKMADDMGKFADNFKLMDESGIYAFKEWTDSIAILSKTDPETFSANVITAKKAIDAGFGVGEQPGMVDRIVDAATAPLDIINKNVNSREAAETKTPQAPAQSAKIDYSALGKAIVSALQNAELNVVIVEDNSDSKRKRK
jgi:hypothetical protein